MKSLIGILTACFFLASCASSKKLTAEPIEIGDSTDLQVDAFPQFEGGDHLKFRSWVIANIQYPTALYQEYIDGFNPALEGRTVAVFIVEKDGSIKNVDITSTPHREFGVVVRQVIRRSPKWTPGYKDGEAVRVRFTLPVDFKLPEGHKEDLERQRQEKINNRRN